MLAILIVQNVISECCYNLFICVRQISNTNALGKEFKRFRFIFIYSQEHLTPSWNRISNFYPPLDPLPFSLMQFPLNCLTCRYPKLHQYSWRSLSVSAYSSNNPFVSGLSMLTKAATLIITASDGGGSSVTTANGSKHIVKISDIVPKRMLPFWLKEFLNISSTGLWISTAVRREIWDFSFSVAFAVGVRNKRDQFFLVWVKDLLFAFIESLFHKCFLHSLTSHFNLSDSPNNKGSVISFVSSEIKSSLYSLKGFPRSPPPATPSFLLRCHILMKSSLSTYLFMVNFYCICVTEI